jgi:hypothetical protein
MLIVAPHELVAGAEKQLHVIDFRARLIEPFAQILQTETDKIHSGRRRHADHLALPHFRRPAGIVRHVGVEHLFHGVSSRQ